MKIQIFKIIKTSYRYGDENGITEILFSTEELMNLYFWTLYNQYKDNKSYHESSSPLTEKECLTCSQFEFNDGGKWSYEVSKERNELTIYESINELI